MFYNMLLSVLIMEISNIKNNIYVTVYIYSQ